MELKDVDFYEIQDDNGYLYGGPYDLVIFIWDCITRDLLELELMYPGHLLSDLEEGKRRYQTEWAGNLKLAHIKKVYAHEKRLQHG